jgi:hypothetical protein
MCRMPYPFHVRPAGDRSTPLEHPSRQGSFVESMLPIQPPMRRIALTLGLLASLALPAAADASQLVARDAQDVTVRVNARGQALIGYSAKGKRWNVLAWGAINARHPTTGQPQVKLQVDYSGGWGTYRQALARGFRNACLRYTGPPLAWFVTGCTMPDGTHWALQAWQRGLPNLGLDPWKPTQAAWELRLSHWNAELPKLELWTNWAYSRRFHHVFGRLTYLGQPAYGMRASTQGNPQDGFGRNVYIDTFNSAYGPGWKRENSFLTHVGTGVFCYGFYSHEPYPGYPAVGRRPEGRGERYRATVVGPGVLPDVTWEGAAPTAYDESLDRQLVDAQRAVYGADSRCKPV